MPAQRIQLQPSGLIAAPSAGGSHPLGTATMGIVYLGVTAVSGSSPKMTAWLEGSPDNGTEWFELPYDLQLTTKTGSEDHSDVTGGAGKRNIDNAGGTTGIAAAGKWVAIYKHLPVSLVRLAWHVSGSFSAGQGFTFYATMDVK